MTAREALHCLVDDLAEGDLITATRVLEALKVAGDPMEYTLRTAPADDEPDDDDFDGGLTEARQEAAAGDILSHEEVKRELGLP
jgi:hypothetical protein